MLIGIKEEWMCEFERGRVGDKEMRRRGEWKKRREGDFLPQRGKV